MVEDELHAHAGAYRLVVVIDRSDAKLRALACSYRVVHRLYVHTKGAVGRQKTAPACDLTVRRIGHTRFNHIIEIRVLPSFGVDYCGHLKGERAVRIEFAGLLGLLIASRYLRAVCGLSVAVGIRSARSVCAGPRPTSSAAHGKSGTSPWRSPPARRRNIASRS